MQINQLENQISQHERDADNSKAAVKELQAENARLQDEMLASNKHQDASLQKQIATLKQQLCDAQNQAKSAQHDNQQSLRQAQVRMRSKLSVCWLVCLFDVLFWLVVSVCSFACLCLFVRLFGWLVFLDVASSFFPLLKPGVRSRLTQQHSLLFVCHPRSQDMAAELEQKLTESSKATEKLEQDMSERNARITALQTQLTKEQSATAACLQEAGANADEALSHAKRVAQEKTQSAVQEEAQKRQQLEDNMASLTAQLAAAKAQISASQLGTDEQTAALAQQLEGVQSELQLLKKTHADTRVKLENAQEQAAKHDNACKQAQQRVKDLENELDAKSNECTMAEDRANDLDSKVRDKTRKKERKRNRQRGKEGGNGANEAK